MFLKEWTSEKTKLAFNDFSKPLIILIFLTLAVRIFNLDLLIQSQFFVKGQGWLYGNTWLWTFLYQYGVIPGFTIAALAGMLLLYCAFSPASGLAKYRKKALFLILLLALGPGLVVNLTFKDNWGRPRPRETIDFAGKSGFLNAWQLGPEKKYHSFPSGHASMGFYLFAPYFLLRRRSSTRKKARLVLAGGIVYGSLMGLGRMVQGGHFLSDVIWSAGFVYLCGLILFYTMRFDKEH